ncbi:MAG: hypothetical protein V4590_12780 [Bacteroidota bacterium]
MILGLIWSIIAALTFLFSGLMVNRLFFKEKDYHKIFIIGIVSYNTLCSALHFFIPLTYIVLVSTLLITTIVLVGSFKKYPPLQLRSKWKIVTLALFIFLFAFYLIAKVAHWDAYLYYNQSVRWFQHYPLIKGIGNLYPKIGFNFNSFTLIATTVLPHKPAFYVFNYILLIFFVSYLLEKVIIRKDRYLALCGAFFMVFSITFLKVNISSPGPDFAIYILTSFLGIELYLQKEITHQESRFFLMIACYLMTIKLSIFPVSLVILYIYRNSLKSEFSFILCVLILIPGVWFIRGVFMSGQLIYPYPPLYSDLLPWAVDSGQVKLEFQSIIGSGRSPKINVLQSANESFTEWFPRWFMLQWNDRVRIIGDTGAIKINLIHFGLYLTALVGIIGASLFKQNRIGKSFKSKKMVLVTGLFLSLGYWLLTAPDFRYVAAIFYVLFFCIHLQFYEQVSNRGIRIAVTTLLTAAIFLRTAGLAYTFIYQDRFNLNKATVFYPKGMLGINGTVERLKPPVEITIAEMNFHYYYNDTIEKTGQQSDEFFPCIASPEHVIFQGKKITDGILDGDAH